MELMDKYTAMVYILRNSPVCIDCARGNLNEVRRAAGLYQLLKDIAAGNKSSFTVDELSGLIAQATSF